MMTRSTMRHIRSRSRLRAAARCERSLLGSLPPSPREEHPRPCEVPQQHPRTRRPRPSAPRAWPLRRYTRRRTAGARRWRGRSPSPSGAAPESVDAAQQLPGHGRRSRFRRRAETLPPRRRRSGQQPVADGVRARVVRRDLASIASSSSAVRAVSHRPPHLVRNTRILRPLTASVPPW
jgi:hypothetical protein